MASKFDAVAESQARHDKLIGPGVPIFIPKTTIDIKSYREQEAYSFQQLMEYVDSFIARFNGVFPELAVQKKYDGANLQVHRNDKGELFAFTEGLQDVTHRLPSLLKVINNELPKKAFILIGELEGWKNGKHIGREDVSGYLNANTPANDMYLALSVFDIIWWENKDIHKDHYNERFNILKEEFQFSQSIISKLRPGLNLTPTFIVKTAQALKKSVATVLAPSESEGAMIKLWQGFPFTLNRRTGEMIKYKKYTEGHFIVLDKKQISGSQRAFQYVIGVLVDQAYKGQVLEKETQEYNGKVYLICGKTFNTSIQAKVGDIITVKFNNLFVYHQNGGKLNLGVYAPNVYENASVAGKKEEPDSVSSILETGQQANILAEKSIGYYISKAIEPFLQYPPESRSYEYVMQAHFRGKSVHTDFRIEHTNILIGYTLMTQVLGVVKEPITTLVQAKAALKNPKLWKFNCLTGRFEQRQIAGGQIRNTSIETALKETQPREWLIVEGVTEGAGSTANYPGVFVIGATGKIEYGYREPYFHEYFIHNDKWPEGGMRLVFRLLSGPEMRSGKHIYIPEMLDPLTDNPDDYTIENGILIFDNGEVILKDFEIDSSKRYFYKLLPPSEEPGRELPFVWLMVKPNDNEPYILSSRARRKDKVPPLGISALPVGVRRQIPADMRYWDTSSQSQYKLKLDMLREAMKGKDDLKLDYGGNTLFKSQISSEWITKAVNSKYVLKKRWWRGPIVVRLGSSATYWDLYFQRDSEWQHFMLMEDPVEYDIFAGILYTDVKSDEVNFEGDLEPGTDLNPNAQLIAQCRILGEGNVSLDLSNSSRWKFAFNTGVLKDRAFTANQDEGSRIWKFSQE
jgi:hypothetical protein